MEAIIIRAIIAISGVFLTLPGFAVVLGVVAVDSTAVVTADTVFSMVVCSVWDVRIISGSRAKR